MEEETPFLGNSYKFKWLVQGIPKAKPVFPPPVSLRLLLMREEGTLTGAGRKGEKSALTVKKQVLH